MFPFEQLACTEWDGTVLSAHRALRRDTLAFFRVPRPKRFAAPSQPRLPQRWADRDEVRRVHADVTRRYAEGGCSAADGDPSWRRRVAEHADVTFVQLNLPVFHAVVAALLAAPDQWMYAEAHEVDVARQAARVALALVTWAYDTTTGRLCAPLLDAYTECARGFTAEWTVLNGLNELDAAAVTPTWRRKRDGSAALWPTLFAYAAYLQADADAEAPGLAAVGGACRQRDWLVRKRERQSVKRGMRFGRSPRSLWWLELSTLTLSALLTAYTAFVRAHLRFLTMVPHDKAPPRASQPEVYGYGPSRRAPAALSDAWHVYLDALTLLHYVLPHLPHLLARGRLAAFQGYALLMTQRWETNACIPRALADLAAHLKPPPNSLLDRLLGETREAARRTQALLRVLASLFPRFTADAITEATEELANGSQAHSTARHPALRPVRVSPAGTGTGADDDNGGRVSFPHMTHKLLDEATSLLNHPRYAHDAATHEEAAQALASPAATELSTCRSVRQTARMMRHSADLLLARSDTDLPWSSRATAYMADLGVGLPSCVTRTTDVGMVLLGIARNATDLQVDLQLDGLTCQHDNGDDDDDDSDEGGEGGGKRREDDGERTSLWNQIQGRDDMIRTWVADIDKNAGFTTARAALQAWSPPDWLDVTVEDGKAAVRRMQKRQHAQEAAQMEQILADLEAPAHASSASTAAAPASPASKPPAGGKSKRRRHAPAPTSAPTPTAATAPTHAPASSASSGATGARAGAGTSEGESKLATVADLQVSRETEEMLQNLVGLAVLNEAKGVVYAEDDESPVAQITRALQQPNLSTRGIILNLGVVNKLGIPARFLVDGAHLQRLRLQMRIRMKKRRTGGR